MTSSWWWDKHGVATKAAALHPIVMSAEYIEPQRRWLLTKHFAFFHRWSGDPFQSICEFTNLTTNSCTACVTRKTLQIMTNVISLFHMLYSFYGNIATEKLRPFTHNFALNSTTNLVCLYSMPTQGVEGNLHSFRNFEINIHLHPNTDERTAAKLKFLFRWCHTIREYCH